MANEVKYDLSKGFSFEDLENLICELHNQPKRKSEYILGAQAAKILPMGMIKYLSENYILLCSAEAIAIIRQREKEEKP
jgi:hypothetical protein